MLMLAKRLNATVFLQISTFPSTSLSRKSPLSIMYLSDSGSRSTSGTSSSARERLPPNSRLAPAYTLVTLLDDDRFTQGPTTPDLFHADIPNHTVRFHVFSFLPSMTGCHVHLFHGRNTGHSNIPRPACNRLHFVSTKCSREFSRLLSQGEGRNPPRRKDNDSLKLTSDAIKHKDIGGG